MKKLFCRAMMLGIVAGIVYLLVNEEQRKKVLALLGM